MAETGPNKQLPEEFTEKKMDGAAAAAAAAAEQVEQKLGMMEGARHTSILKK